MFKRMLVLSALALCQGSFLSAGEIGFVEDYSLATNRAEPMKQLIPGTEDYYYYHCLYYQQTGDYAKVKDTLSQWIKRHNETGRVKEIQNRQALLDYAKNPAGSLDYLKKELGLRFDHQKQLLDGAIPTHPTSLDPALIRWDTLRAAAIDRDRDTLNGFEDSAFDRLVREDLNADLRRHLLSRLARPDHPGLPNMIIGDLKYKHSGGFGSHPIHRQLLLAQLDQCLDLMPNLLAQTGFVNAYLTKLRPAEDINWEYDLAEKKAFLDRLYAFTQRLPPVHNSLKAHVLYNRLDFDRQEGVYNKGLFMEYIKLPRQVFYMNREYLAREANARHPADLNANFKAATTLSAIVADEPLVRDYLQRLLLNAKGFDEFSEYIESTYLKEAFAEAKIVNGIGDLEEWYSLLPAEKYNALKERVDLELLPVNRRVFGNADKVTLHAAIKNVNTLIVKIFKLNTLNVYKEKGQDIGTDIDLDGLVANEEKVVKYSQVPLRRHVESFEFSSIKEPGVYVVELIGNGVSSRALIRKGRLTFSQRVGSAGHVFTVYDEDNRRVKDATLWLAGREYKPDEKGEIIVPFSNQQGAQKIILCRGHFSSLEQFEHRSESYHLRAGFFADLESLLAGRTCRLIVRPQLVMNGIPVDVGLLQEVVFTIRTTDSEGISTAKDIPDFKLQNDRETVYEFKVPEKLSDLSFTLRGKVENLSQGKKVDVSASHTIGLNRIDKTEKIEALELRHADGRYALELHGKTGEARPNRPVQLEVKPRDFKDTVHATLQTDASGRVGLGELKGITWVRASGPEGVSQQWTLAEDRHSSPGNIHAPVGKPVAIPFMGAVPTDKSEAASLLELRDGTFVRDCLSSVSFKDGFLVIDDLAPGEYSLVIKPEPAVNAAHIRIAPGKLEGAVLISQDYILEARNPAPLQIVSAQPDEQKKALRIQLRNAGQSARVHVVANRFVPGSTLMDGLGFVTGPTPAWTAIDRPVSLYVSGRSIGDEYRYILERKYVSILPGNMLKRPSLLLNPWSLRKTDAGEDPAKAGEAMRGIYGGGTPGARGSTRYLHGGSGRAEAGAFANLDFLPTPSLVLANRVPDKDGVVTIDLAEVGPRQQLHVLALDNLNAAYREVSLPGSAENFKDIRLAQSLDPQKHFTEQKNISVVPAGGAFGIPDITTAQVEVYDSLARVYALLMTLSNDPTLAEFSFVLGWPDLKPETKCELYSKYACHELSFFLSRKDPAFFESVIRPYLKNKKDKTFMDHWLLGADLSGHLKPWAYGRLNVPERILLARRIQAGAAAGARDVKELWELIPPDLERFNRLFSTALKGSAMETTDALGFNEAKKDAAPPAPVLAAVEGIGGGAAAAMPQEMRKAGRIAATPAAAPARPTAKALAEEKPGKEVAAEALFALADKEQSADGALANAAADRSRRQAVRQLYRKLDKTEEWVENNYYRLPIEQQLAGLVDVNGFWKDYAACPIGQPFLSTAVAEAAGSFTEMMLALSVLDLPFKPGKHETAFKDVRMDLKAASPAVIYHKETREAAMGDKTQPILTRQNFFARDDRYRQEGNERFDKFITGEFLPGRVYGAQVVLTNPTSARRKVDVLLQIPRGAIPVLNGFVTRSLHRQLEPYSTQTVEYYFYFPLTGKFTHYPVHVAQAEKVVAFTEPFEFNVVEKLTQIDKTSWPYLSQNGTGEEVIRHLQDNNIHWLDLDLIAFRMREPAFYKAVMPLLQARHIYDDTLWSYGLLHNDVPAIREYLQHSPFAAQCGLAIESPLLTLDPVIRHAYQHREYWPLVNPRVYPLGKKRKILNEQFHQQYIQWLTWLQYRPGLSDADRLVTVGYLLLQDRVEEAMALFDRVDPKAIETTMQYDYTKAYIAFCREKPAEARAIAKKYEDHPVDRWRNVFQDVIAQVDEIEGKAARVVDKDDRDQVQTRLAETEPGLEFKVEDRKIAINFQNLVTCQINYYLMDIELLFSRNPFVQEVSGQFAIIHPNRSDTVKLPKKGRSHTVELPGEYRDRNVMIEIVAGGITKTQAYYPHSLNIQVLENYGQVKVTDLRTDKPLSRVYVKVFAKMKSGSIQFYKDGYTDLRGRFDYASLNTDEIENVEALSILIMSDANGSAVREAAPPKM